MGNAIEPEEARTGRERGLTPWQACAPSRSRLGLGLHGRPLLCAPLRCPPPLHVPAGFAIIRQRLLWLVCFLTDRRSGVRNSLVAALVGCADHPLKSEARRFLAGLSSDELQFIAEFLGSCVLESQVRGGCNRAELAERIVRFQQARADRGPRGSTEHAHHSA